MVDLLRLDDPLAHRHHRPPANTTTPRGEKDAAVDPRPMMDCDHFRADGDWWLLFHPWPEEDWGLGALRQVGTSGSVNHGETGVRL